jgi:DNA-binding beta-propeller fold protein YncE
MVCRPWGVAAGALGAMMPNYKKLLVGLSLGMLLMVGLATSVGAVGQGELVMTGLNGPQGVLVTADGSIWALDSGLGGKAVTFDTTDPETGKVEKARYGVSARIVRRMPDGQMVEVTKAPSTAIGMGANGGMRLALLADSPSSSFASRSDVQSLGGRIYFTSGEWTLPDDQTVGKRLRGMASVMSLENGLAVEIVNTFDIEKQNNFDQTLEVESHPYGITAGKDGMLYVADAAANALLQVNPLTREVKHLATIGPIPGVFPSAARKGALLADPVPTAVVVNDDGTFLVSLLSGAPFVPGSSKIVMVKDGQVSDYITGLTMTTDLKRGPDGMLYAVQFGQATQQGFVPKSGSVLRLAPGKAPETVADGLSFPTTAAFDRMGNMFVTINSVGAPGSGQIWKFADVAK